MVIAVDFDGTIVEDRYPEIGEERPFATEVLRKFIQKRHKLVLWTVRNGKLLDEALKWCEERGVQFYAVNSDSPEMMKEERSKYHSYKLNADVFIDDKNVSGLPTWTEIYEIVEHGKSYAQIIRHQTKKELQPEDERPYPSWMFWKKSKNKRRR